MHIPSGILTFLGAELATLAGEPAQTAAAPAPTAPPANQAEAEAAPRARPDPAAARERHSADPAAAQLAQLLVSLLEGLAQEGAEPQNFAPATSSRRPSHHHSTARHTHHRSSTRHATPAQTAPATAPVRPAATAAPAPASSAPAAPATSAPTSSAPAAPATSAAAASAAPSTAPAATGASGTPNPHTTGQFTPEHILDDSAFTNVNSMSTTDIQHFLERNGTELAHYHGRDGRSAAEMISDASRRNGVNPQVILATLQKEQGLIRGEHSRHLSQGRLDWALGYGAMDSRRLERYRGFETQIDAAAHRMRQLYDRNQSRVPTTMNIDGHPQRIDNATTLMLYQYTPHAHGNRLFHDVWRGFFGGDGLGRPA